MFVLVFLVGLAMGLHISTLFYRPMLNGAIVSTGLGSLNDICITLDCIRTDETSRAVSYLEWRLNKGVSSLEFLAEDSGDKALLTNSIILRAKKLQSEMNANR